MDAAKAAAPYVHPRLAATTVAGDTAAPITYVFRWMDETDDEHFASAAQPSDRRPEPR
jgi:hypothetical protein